MLAFNHFPANVTVSLQPACFTSTLKEMCPKYGLIFEDSDFLRLYSLQSGTQQSHSWSSLPEQDARRKWPLREQSAIILQVGAPLEDTSVREEESLLMWLLVPKITWKKP